MICIALRILHQSTVHRQPHIIDKFNDPSIVYKVQRRYSIGDIHTFDLKALQKTDGLEYPQFRAIHSTDLEELLSILRDELMACP